MTYPGQPVVDFTYDWVGNRSLSGSVYNAADQLASANGHAYGYDGAGNLATVDSVPRYDYTFDHLLHTAGSASMTWDAAGNRVGFSSPSAGSYSFVYDPTAGIPAVVKEVTPGGPVYYVREPGGALICRVDGETTQYYHFDDLGSTLFLTDSSGTVTDKYRYDAWGNVSPDPDNTTQQPYQYVGQLGYYTHYQDPNMSGLLQLGVRFYDPETGRFTQRDPIGDGLNWYGYVGGNPVSGIDPSGLMTDEQCAKIRELLEYERTHTTGNTARRFSNTWGKYTPGPLRRLGWGARPLEGYFDNVGVPTSVGEIDLDWFTDLTSFHVWPHQLDYVTPMLDSEYIIGKSIWNDSQMIVNLLFKTGTGPGTLQIIYEDPKERVALKAVRRGLSYADLFPPELLERECPKKCK